ncbi:tetratricopeptide repeat protein [Nocardioides sp. LHG3406-4]|uniref:tetratricopeptide repeat protein n=1 Tax=Nocardioides sp. LHG3406-4 TaxID=2804575 RepID=UPI003CF6BD52
MSKSLRLLAASAVLALTGTLAAGCSSDGKPDAEASANVQASGSAAPAPASAALVKKGLAELAAGDASTAKVTFENVLAIDPDNAYAHYNLGVIAQQDGRDKAAMKSYDAALDNDDAFAPALYNKAILTEGSDLDAAVELYRRAVDADPAMAAAHMRLGFALVHLGKVAEGEEHLGTGVSLDPSMAEVKAPSYD